MALYAIGDTHLSLSVDKPMDIFGGSWSGYVEKLREGFEEVSAGGLCVFGRSARKKAADEGQPRLLVDHRRKDEPVFCGKRLYQL